MQVVVGGASEQPFSRSMLSLRNLRRPGLAPVNLDLEAGEAVAVLGPSGSGKSLFLRAIADLDPNEGDISLDGIERNAIPAPGWRRMVAYLPAEPGWWAETVSAHFPNPEAANEFMARLDLPDNILERTIATLSTGERQRLALVRLLLRSPRVLLLDEATAGLDEASRDKVEELLREQRALGRTLLFATHDKTQARRLAKRCLEVASGRVTEAKL